MTKWTDFVKDYAKAKGLTYGCALSDPECSKTYKSKYGVSKKLPKWEEHGNMTMEDVNVNKLKFRKKPTGEQLINKVYNNIPAPRQPKSSQPTQQLEVANREFIPPPAKKGRGRPKKYADPEEAKKAKTTKTVESNARKRKEKKEMTLMGKEDKMSASGLLVPPVSDLIYPLSHNDIIKMFQV